MLIKKKASIYWITPESFLDVDIPVIEQLVKEYKIFWHIIGFDRSYRGMYSLSEIDLVAKKNHINYIIHKQKFRFSNPLIILFYLQIIRKIRKFKMDLLYTSYLGEPIFLFLLILYIPVNKMVIANHDIYLHSSEKNIQVKNLYHKFYRKLYSNFHLFSNTQTTLFRQTFENKKILTTPLCIKDFGKPTHVNKSTKVRFLFFGTILPYKGLDILLNAVNYLIETCNTTNFTLTIAGNISSREWNEYAKLVKYPKFIRLETRTIRNIEIADLFCNSDYLVLPYKDVTQCGPLMIAFNYFLPVIASDLPGFGEYISVCETGYLFNNKDFKNLAEVMANCIQNNYQDFLSGNIMRIVKNKFTPEVISPQYIKYFNTLLYELD
jgi:glycosyltransferase involved in cell wall biosynthesis